MISELYRRDYDGEFVITNTIFKDARIKHLEISECIFEKTAYGAPSDITRAQTGKYEIDGIEYENETN